MSRVVHARRARPLQGGVGLLGADLDDGADRILLHLGIGVAEHRRQLVQRLVAAEHPQQIDGGAAHGRVGRVLERFHGLASGRAEADQQLAQPPDGVDVVLVGERFGERPHHRRTELSGTTG